MLGVLVEPHVRHTHALVRFLPEIGAGVGADPAVTGGVRHEFRAEDPLAAGTDVDRLDRGDAVAVHDDAGREVAEEEADVLLGADDLLLELVAEAVDAARAIGGAVRDLLDDLAEVRVLAAGGAAHGPDADLRAAVAAEDEAVLDERDLQRLPGAREGRPEAAVAAAHDDEVEFALVFRPLRAVPLRAGGDQRLALGRGEGGVLAEEDGVGATGEAGEVMEGEFHVARGQGDLAAGLPMPFGSLVTEFGSDRLAVDDQLEAARGARRFPVGDPILGAYPDPVLAGGGDADGAGGVADRFAEAVGEEVRRADDVGESRVEFPAAVAGEGLGLDEDGVGALGAAGEGGQAGEPEEGEQTEGHGF